MIYQFSSHPMTHVTLNRVFKVVAISYSPLCGESHINGLLLHLSIIMAPIAYKSENQYEDSSSFSVYPSHYALRN